MLPKLKQFVHSTINTKYNRPFSPPPPKSIPNHNNAQYIEMDQQLRINKSCWTINLAYVSLRDVVPPGWVIRNIPLTVHLRTYACLYPHASLCHLMTNGRFDIVKTKSCMKHRPLWCDQFLNTISALYPTCCCCSPQGAQGGAGGVSVAARQGPVPAARAGGQAMAVSFAEPDHEQAAAHRQQPQATQRGRSVRWCWLNNQIFSQSLSSLVLT